MINILIYYQPVMDYAVEFIDYNTIIELQKIIPFNEYYNIILKNKLKIKSIKEVRKRFDKLGIKYVISKSLEKITNYME